MPYCLAPLTQNQAAGRIDAYLYNLANLTTGLACDRHPSCTIRWDPSADARVSAYRVTVWGIMTTDQQSMVVDIDGLRPQTIETFHSIL